MTERQRLKHIADNAKVAPSATLIGTDRDNFNMAGFREPRTPRLSWLNGKTYKQHGDSQKNRPGRKPEHADALYEYQFVKEEKSNASTTGPNLPDHQGEGSDVAAGTPQA